MIQGRVGRKEGGGRGREWEMGRRATGRGRWGGGAMGRERKGWGNGEV